MNDSPYIFEIPKTWKWVKIRDITAVIRGASPRPKGDPRYFGGQIPWVMISDISREPGKYLTKTKEGVTEAGAKLSRLLNPGSLILSNSGTVCVPKILKIEGCIHDGFVSFPTLPSQISKDYLYHWFDCVRPKVIQQNKQGITQVNLNTEIVRELDVPLPSANEQRRIVEKIEELFSHLDAGVAALQRAKANLKRYRASVLKAAVDGSLTAEWRAKHPNVEPASKLLERILIERRRKWEADQLAKFNATGKEPPKNWRAKYVDPAPPDTTNLPEVPESWCWASVEQVAEFARYGSSAKTDLHENGVPVLRMGNIVDGNLDLSDLKYLPSDHSEFPFLLLETGDLLFNRTNSAELVGKSAVYCGIPSPCSYASYLIAVRCITGYDSRFLCMYINSANGRQWVKSVVSQQVGQANVNGTKLQALAVPFPPLDEQAQIVSEIAEKLSQIEAGGIAIDHGLLRASRLRQSILKQAFEGRLVPQDPNDEPASKLLERIKAQSGQAVGNGKSTPSRRKRSTQKTK